MLDFLLRNSNSVLSREIAATAEAVSYQFELLTFGSSVFFHKSMQPFSAVLNLDSCAFAAGSSGA